MNYDQLHPGFVITYRLLSRDLPTRPERLWHGRIEDISRSGANPLVGFCYVTVLDEGYEEMTELVFFNQIVEERRTSLETMQSHHTDRNDLLSLQVVC